MNNLNSVLLDGTVVAKPVRDAKVPGTPEGEFSARFDVESTRIDALTHQGETIVVKVVSVPKTHLNDFIMDRIKPDVKVRVVGRLTQEANNGRIFLVAEHVEIKTPRERL